MDRSNNDADPSAGYVPYGPGHFNNVSLYPTTNNPTYLKKKDVEGFYTAYHIPRGAYQLYMTDSSDRIHHTPPVLACLGDMAIGISESSFKCGFKVPLLRLYKTLFRQMNIAFGQMDPNDFIHINSLQHCCLAEGLHPSS